LRKCKLAVIILVILFATVIFAACARGSAAPQELITEIREDLTAASRLIITAEVTADYGDRVYTFGIRYTGNIESGEILITSPELIAGVVAEISGGCAALVFDGARLETGALSGSGLTPIEALPLLMSEWQGGRIGFTGFEKFGDHDAVTMESLVDESVTKKTWFDRTTLLPLRAELSYNGTMIIAAEFSGFVIE